MKGNLIPEKERMKHMNLTFDAMSKYQYEQYKKHYIAKRKTIIIVILKKMYPLKMPRTLNYNPYSISPI